MFSNLNLNEKSFCWLLDIMAKFAEITYYSDIYVKDEVISIIFDKFIVKQSYICQVFQFMRSLVETGPLFKYYSNESQIKLLIDQNLSNTDLENICIQFFNISEILKKERTLT